MVIKNCKCLVKIIKLVFTKAYCNNYYFPQINACSDRIQSSTVTYLYACVLCISIYFGRYL